MVESEILSMCLNSKRENRDLLLASVTSLLRRVGSKRIAGSTLVTVMTRRTPAGSNFVQISTEARKGNEGSGSFSSSILWQVYFRPMHRSAGKARDPCALAPTLPLHASVKSLFL